MFFYNRTSPNYSANQKWRSKNGNLINDKFNYRISIIWSIVKLAVLCYNNPRKKTSEVI